MMTAINFYTCINCGQQVPKLFKKYSNTVKTVHCEKCRKVADKYIEFELAIILVDAILLSESAFRHMIYNRDFKINWKLSLVLLLLDSFALWRRKRDNVRDPRQNDLVNEKGFYLCCLQNLVDYALLAFLLLCLSILLGRKQQILANGLMNYVLLLLKAIAIANLSQFFLLPIMVWRDSSTEVGTIIHQVLVLGHHLCSLIFTFDVVCNCKRAPSILLVIPAYILKEYLKVHISVIMENNL